MAKPLSLEQRVLGFLRENRLLEDTAPLVVAVSGGADSTCLLLVLAALREELGISLHVAHLNHRLRGEEGEADADYVLELAARLGLPATLEARDVKAYRAERRISLEEAAREVRYSFLAEVAERAGAARVAVGHTRDDHIETVLMHLIRGAGTRGLRGLLPLSRWPAGGRRVTVIRPLLGVGRPETEAYCREHGREPRIDSTNLSLSPFRNRLRLRLLPLLEGYNPQVKEALLRTARTSARDLDFIEAQAAPWWDRLAGKEGEAVTLEREVLRRLHPSLQYHLLRRALEELLGNLRDIDLRHLEEMMKLLDKPAGRQISLPGGLILGVEYHRYVLAPGLPSPFPPLPGEFPLNIPGETNLAGWRVEAEVLNRPHLTDADFVLPSPAGQLARREFTAYLDPDKAGPKLSLRHRLRGDRFQPLGLGQPKKLSHFMIDARIPRAWREGIPLVCSPRHILWVVGWRVDERVRVVEGTRRVLRLRMVVT